MTDHQVRTILDKLHNLCRFVHEAAESDAEAILLTSVLSTALLGVLEFAEANHTHVLHEADWSTVKTFFTLHPGLDA